MQELELQKAVGFALHPKMEELLNILVQCFGQLEEGDETRVMVFSSYRAVVDRIVEELSKHEPLLRATRFIGQGTDKQGNKGLAQKEQQEVSVIISTIKFLYLKGPRSFKNSSPEFITFLLPLRLGRKALTLGKSMLLFVTTPIRLLRGW